MVLKLPPPRCLTAAKPSLLGFCLFFGWFVSCFWSFETRSHGAQADLEHESYVAKDDLEILILLYLLPKCWDCVVVPLCPASTLSQVGDALVIISVGY